MDKQTKNGSFMESKKEPLLAYLFLRVNAEFIGIPTNKMNVILFCIKI